MALARDTPPLTLRERARALVRLALEQAIDSGRLPDSPEARSVEVEVSRPGNQEHGDLASNVAMRLAKPMRMAPPVIAAAIAAELGRSAEGGPVGRAEPAGAG